MISPGHMQWGGSYRFADRFWRQPSDDFGQLLFCPRNCPSGTKLQGHGEDSEEVSFRGRDLRSRALHSRQSADHSRQIFEVLLGKDAGRIA